MTTVTRYPTRPIQIWPKTKELRRKLNRLAWEAKDEGGVVAASQAATNELLAGIGLWGRRLYGPYFAVAMKNPEVLEQYHEAADVRGFPRGEMCSSMHHYVGELLLGLTTKNPYTGAESPVDFVYEMEFCHSVAKTAQLAAEVLGVPAFVLDMPQTGGEAAIRYVAGRMQEAIEFLEKTTGKRFDDELLIEAIQNFWEQGAYAARLACLNRAVPAPLDFETLTSLCVPSAVAPHRAEVKEYMGELLAEVEQRVRDGISMYGLETARLCQEGEPMYFAERFLAELVKRYGAVIAAGYIPFGRGLWDISEDGQWTPVPLWRDLGVTLGDRASALELLARIYLEHKPLYHCQRLHEKTGEYVHRAQDWRCDGSILLLDIGCRSQAMGVLEARRALEEAGIPTVTYTASNGDAANFSPEQVASSIESFLERLGLRPIG